MEVFCSYFQEDFERKSKLKSFHPTGKAAHVYPTRNRASKTRVARIEVSYGRKRATDSSSSRLSRHVQIRFQRKDVGSKLDQAYLFIRILRLEGVERED